MARATRSSLLETRTARLKLEQGKRHTQNIDQGLKLVYRRGPTGGGWYVKLRQADGRYVLNVLGTADDHQDANGVDVLTYYQAQTAARAVGDKAKKTDGIVQKPLTVAEVMALYLDWFSVHRKSAKSTAYAVERHILPALGKKDAAALGADDIRKWQQALVTSPKRHRGKAVEIDISNPDLLRRRKATANRILASLKAALNKAVELGKLKGSAEEWCRVKPFPKVDAPKIRYLSVEECTRLLNACDPVFRPLARAALLTGCRYGELTRMRVADFNRDMALVTVTESKSGKPRHVPLTDEGRRQFDAMTAGKGGSELIFTHADGSPWGRSHQTRPMQDASAAAQISPLVGFHDLRNTYGALLAMRGVSLLVIAELLGHSDTRITQRHYAHLSPSYVADTLRANLPEFGGSVDNGSVTRLPTGSGKI